MLADLPAARGSTPPGVAGDDLAAAPLGGAAAAQPVADLLPRRTRSVSSAAARSPARRANCSPATRTPSPRWPRCCPQPIDHFLLQADLTVIVPGPLERELAEQLAAVATVESAGAAMVYRISEPSIRRALDTGRTAGELHALFDRHSKTPVPQGLTYLIDDVARRHGQLRVGMAASFVRCEDPALLAQAVGAPADRTAGDAAARPDRRGVAGADLRGARGAAQRGLRPGGRGLHRDDRRHPGPRRAGARPAHRRVPRPLTPPAGQTLSAIVAVLRKVAATPFANIRIDPAVAISQLQEAARLQNSVVIGYVDPAGVATQRVVAPINVRGGQLTAYDPGDRPGPRLRHPPRHVGGVGRRRTVTNGCDDLHETRI